MFLLLLSGDFLPLEVDVLVKISDKVSTAAPPYFSIPAANVSFAFPPSSMPAEDVSFTYHHYSMTDEYVSFISLI